MFKNRIKKLIITLLSALLIFPAFSINAVSAAENGGEDVTTVFLGMQYEYEVEKSLDIYLQAGADKVSIFAIKEETDKNEIFKDGKDVENDDYFVNYTVTSTNATISIVFHKMGYYTINLESVDKFNYPADTFEKKFKVVDDYTDAGLKLEYKSDLTSAIDDYKEEVDAATKNSDKAQLVVGKDSFKVPSVKNLINSSFAYSSVKKTVYYSVPGQLSYKSTTSTSGTPSFSVSEYGTYRFYTLLESDNLVDNAYGKKQVETTGLKEFNDGFYQVKNGSDKVYYNPETNLFYEDIDFEILINTDGENQDKTDDGKLANEDTKDLIIPIFEFTLTKTAPKIEIDAQILEDGYKGAKYSSVGQIKIYGNPEDVEYILQYRERKEVVNWTDLDGEDDSFDSTELTFTPSKLGEYRIKVVARTSGFDKVELATPVISVSQEYIEYKYKVSFSDWLSVNVVPFILLCVSAACLIGIILLLVIKPKNKTNKIQIKEEDR